MTGWLKVHRKLKDSSFYKDSQAVHLWLHLLLCANHKEAEVLIGQQIVKVKPGQFITGRKKLSEATGIAESKIQRVLKVFEKCTMIEQQTFTKYRVISITNFTEYQLGEQQTNSKRTTDEQQMNTNKNDKNEKKDNKPYIPYQKILDMYHEHASNLSKVEIYTDKRKRAVKQFWNQDDKHRELDFYERYFKYVNQQDFLCGKIEPTGNRTKPFKADLLFLMNIDNLAKIVEGKYNNG